MRTLIGFVTAVSYVSGQCSKTSSPFQLGGANDQFAACVLPNSNNAPVAISLVPTIPDSAVCAMACDEGYDSQTPTSRTIVCNGTNWMSYVDTSVVCPPLVCPDLPSPSGSSSASCTGAVEGDLCNMACDSGYAPNQYNIRACRGGAWSGVPFTCTPMVCPTIVAPADSTGTSCVGMTEGNTCTFGCQASATSAGSSVRTCTNGAWTGTPFTCTPANSCPQLYSPPGAYVSVCVHVIAGGTCTFVAMPGYTITNAMRTCQANMTWDGANAYTTAQSCPALPAPTNAETTTGCSASPEGTVCTHQCRNGFVSNNKGVFTCHNQMWIGAALVCSPQNCPLLSSPDNALVASCDNAVDGTLCTFFCKPGYKPVGHSARVCRAGAWTGYSFQCLAATDQYSWIASSYGACVQNGTGAPCGTEGVFNRDVECIDTSGAQYVNVSTTFCHNQLGSHDVSQTLACSIETCPTYNWQFGPWDTCSAECGTGYQERSALCISSTGAVVDGSLCPFNATTGRQACNTQACVGAYWSASEWTPCSGVCYDGQGYNNTRTRYLQCLDVLGNLAPVAQCATAPPPITQECGTLPCAAYTWSSCPWEACTAQCNGGGTKAGLMAGQRQRNVFCLDGQGNGVAPSLCELFGLPSPVTLLVGCNPDACTNFNWMTTPWSVCAGSGTQGLRTRTYHCHAADGSNVLNSMCPNPPPTTQEACIPNSCPTMAPTVQGTSRPTPQAVSSASRFEISVLAIILVSIVVA